MTLSLTSVLSCNLLILVAAGILCITNRDYEYIRFGQSFLLVCIAACMIRLVFPVELGFTVSVYFTHILPQVKRFMYHVHSFAGFQFTFWNIILLIWAMGAILRLCQQVHKNIRFLEFQKLAAPMDKSSLASVLSRLDDDSMNKFSIYLVSPGVTPFYTGFIHPKIFLPNTDYTEDELFYILRHELAHYHNHDLWIKATVEVFTVIYWWNPLVYFLRNKLFQLLELRADKDAVHNLPQEEIGDYAECLLKNARQVKELNYMVQSSMASNNSLFLKQRFALLLRPGYTSKKKYAKYIFISVALVIILTLSTVFIFEPYTDIPQDYKEDGMFSLIIDELYAIKTDEGYDIYLNDQRYDYMEKLPEALSQIPIYHSIEEVQNDK